MVSFYTIVIWTGRHWAGGLAYCQSKEWYVLYNITSLPTLVIVCVLCVRSYLDWNTVTPITSVTIFKYSIKNTPSPLILVILSLHRCIVRMKLLKHFLKDDTMCHFLALLLSINYVLCLFDFELQNYKKQSKS